MLTIRKPYFAGKLYPSDKLNLEREIAIYLEFAVNTGLSFRPRGIILPHGGYRHTGGIVARALSALINQSVESVILLAPYHRFSEKSMEFFSGDAYDTPLGGIPTDKMLLKKLVQLGLPEKFVGIELHDSEDYAIEINLPFFQEVFRNFRLLPVFVSNQITTQDMGMLVNLLEKADIPDHTLLVSTVNLSKDLEYDQAVRHDQKILDYLRTKKLKELQSDFKNGSLRICGLVPLIIQLLYMHRRGYKNIEIVSYRNTGDIEGKKERTAGYFSALIG